jgi:hypothetical protein
MKRLPLKLSGLLLATLFTINGHADQLISVEDAWVREAPPGVQILAGYMTIHNHASEADALIGVSSDCCKKIEMHESVMQGGAMTMQQHEQVALPAASRTICAAGGLHLMLFNPVKPLRAGEQVVMQLKFARHAPIMVTAGVKRATGSEEHHQHHHHHEK